ncbi:2305_t:CDS:2, partial [Dentiscutata heterogama]
MLKLLPEPKDLEISYDQEFIYKSCATEQNPWNSSLKIKEKFSNNLINSSDDAKIQIHASAKAIEHDLILDSKIKTSYSDDPNSYLLQSYEIQIISGYNYYSDENVIMSVK